MRDDGLVLLAFESNINETEGHHITDQIIYDVTDDFDSRMFRRMQREYGRCTSHVYHEKQDGTITTSGWVFQKIREYEDSGRYGRKVETYMHEVWVSFVLFECEECKKEIHYYHKHGDINPFRDRMLTRITDDLKEIRKKLAA